MRRGGARTASTVTVVLLSLLAASCTPPAVTRSPPPAPDEPDPLSMQVVAHPDDDLLFMNPHLTTWIRRGLPVVTVYLTSGESDHDNSRSYAADRQRGTRAAYAAMAGVRNEWTVRELRLGSGHSAELYQLEQRPNIKLVWLNLPEDNNPRAAGGKHALTRLWSDRSGPTAVRSLVPLSGGVHERFRYTHGDLVSVLATLFERFAPTVLRTQDGVPDARYRPEWGRFHDHPDHVMTARFTRQAAEHYFAGSSRHRAVVVNYRDYNIADAPVNLAPEDRRRKREHFAAYVSHDSAASTGGPYARWTKRTHYRWPRGTSWPVRDNGRLFAYAVVGHQLQVWVRDGDGGWSGPREVGGVLPHLRPAVSVIATPDGTSVLARAASPVSGVVRGGFHSEWTDLGSPNAGDGPTAREQVGAPAAVTAPDGRAVVVVRNAGGGLSVWRKAGGWTDIGGGDVQGRPAVVVDGRGRVHVYAATTEKVLHWAQRSAGGELRMRPTPLPGLRPAGRPVADRRADGTIAVAVRVAESGRIAVSRDGAAPVLVESPGGIGTPEVVSADGRTELFARNSGGGVSTSVLPAVGTARWTDLGGFVVGAPAATANPDGSITVVALGPGGRLLVNRREGGTWRGWHPATAP